MSSSQDESMHREELDGSPARGDIPSGIGRTALAVAAVRAAESGRPGRLFNDPYAEAFLAAAPDLFDAERRSAESGAAAEWAAVFRQRVVVRTRFYDDQLLAACARGIRQIVLLAAGLDTRAYRLPWPSRVRLYELDVPEVLDFKDRVLGERSAQPGCARTPVAVDLRENWTATLIAAGLATDKPTAWLAEGLLIYLSADEAAALFTGIGALSPTGSELSLEIEDLNADPDRRQAHSARAMQQYSAMWKGGLPDAPAWLAAHGWDTRIHDRDEVGVGYGRPRPAVTSYAAGPGRHGAFLTALRP